MAKVKYEWTLGSLIADRLCEECSELYSRSYGVWSDSSPYNPGGRIKLSPERIRRWFDDQQSCLYYARVDGELIGYAIAVMIKEPRYRPIVWVTQLVVDERYRHQGVAKRLLFAIWGISSHYAWGIVTSNPYAVRALERATRRRCSLKEIKSKGDLIERMAVEHLPYVDDDTEMVIDGRQSKVNTRFFVDHSDLQDKIDRVTGDGVPWVLGPLEEGWEWVAFTFSKQEPMEFTKKEVEEMLASSDEIARQAYSKMSMTSDLHAWARHTDHEVDMIKKLFRLEEGSSVVDFGCGFGRHSVALAEQGFACLGIDYIESGIDYASGLSSHLDNCWFTCADILDYEPEDQYDAALCLYDVVGSYVDDGKNERILAKMFDCLKAGGKALVSVMNYALTESIATHKFTFSKDPNLVQKITASDTMARTGNIFDPNYMLLDTETHVVYRREQFMEEEGWDLPVELIVRDRRFAVDEIKEMCEKVGFKVLFSRHVHAGDWKTPLAPTDASAKEILLLLERPRQ